MTRRLHILISLPLVAALACSDDSGPSSKDSGVQDTGPATEAGQMTCPKDFPIQANGVCLSQKADKEGQRTPCGEIVDDCDTAGTKTPNLACITSAPPARPTGPATMDLGGFVDVFSSGPDADAIIVEVYDAKALIAAIDADAKAGKLKKKTFPSSVKPLGTDSVTLIWTDKKKVPEDSTRGKARACPKEAKLKLKCKVPTNDCTACDMGGHYCDKGQCIERLRWETRYLIKGMPTNKYLVVRVIGKDGFSDGTWGTMAKFGVYLRADAKKCADGQFNDCLNANGNYELEVNALSKSDYTTIPITAGLSGGVPEGHGAVAGEVHDCDDIKLSAFQVGTYPTPTVLAYFNGNPIKTLPDLSRQAFGTNIDGLFSALDIVPGKVVVSAQGLVGGKLVFAGQLNVAVLPDTVSVVTFEGQKPAP